MEIVKKEEAENQEAKPETGEDTTSYVFITFPPTEAEAEIKRLLGKLEDFFPKYEFVLGNPAIWKQEVEHILNVDKAIQLDGIVKDDFNQKRALNAAQLAKECLSAAHSIHRKEEGADAEGQTEYFYYWELKQALKSSGKFPKISNKETKELISFLELFGYVKSYRTEKGQERYCLVISKKDEKDFFTSSFLQLDQHIANLKEQRDALEKKALDLEEDPNS